MGGAVIWKGRNLKGPESERAGTRKGRNMKNREKKWYGIKIGVFDAAEYDGGVIFK